MKSFKGMLFAVALFAIGSVHTSDKSGRSSSRPRKNPRTTSSKEASIKSFISGVCRKYADEPICRKGFGKDRRGNVVITSCPELEDIANKIAEKYPNDINLTSPILRSEISRHWYSGSARDVRAMQEYADKTLRTYSEYERF